MRKATLTAAIGAVALLCIAGPAFSATGSTGVVGSPAAQSRAKVLAYWTPARMAAAIPRGLARQSSGLRAGGSSKYTISLVSDAERLGFPGRTNGKVYMTIGATNYVCSGTAVASANESTVLTAGHCVWDDKAGFASNFMFVPAKSGSSTPYGVWTARAAAPALYTTSQWAETSGNNFSFDLGAAVVSTNSGATLTDSVGGRSVTFGGARSQSYTLYGYPASGKYSGQYLYKCSTRYAMDDPGSSVDPKPIGVSCNWPGGSSGGAWIGAGGDISSVTSFGYSSLPDYVFGPYLGTVASVFYADVQDN